MIGRSVGGMFTLHIQMFDSVAMCQVLALGLSTIGYEQC